MFLLNRIQSLFALKIMAVWQVWHTVSLLLIQSTSQVGG
jgi:hypothetical protein